MKKVTFLTLVISLIIPLVLITACQQSVEPGENGFPELQEIETLMLQKKHWQKNATMLHEMIYEKQEWIKGINRLYLDYPNLPIAKDAGAYGAFRRLLPKYIPDLQAVINGEKKPILKKGFTIFDAWFLSDYYMFLRRIKPSEKNGLK